MRRTFLIALIAVMTAPQSAHAAIAPAPAPIATLSPQQHAKLSALEAKLSPSARAKLNPLIARVRAQLTGAQSGDPAATARNGIPGLFSGLGAPDIEELVFVVMAEAANDSESDLKSIMDGVQAINKQKDAQRSQMNTINRNIAAPSAPPHGIGAAPTPTATAKDSLNELGEEQQLRLQMAMDRRTKFMEALSNIEKKIADTDSSIIGNLK
jgi:hypothetical protein